MVGAVNVRGSTGRVSTWAIMRSPVRLLREICQVVPSEEAIGVLKAAAETVAASPDHEHEFIEPPDVVGVEQLTVDGAVIRTIAKTTADAQPIVQRELRRALTEALDLAGLSERIAASRLVPRSAVPPVFTQPSEPGPEPGSAN